MKKILFYICASLASLGVTSCTENEMEGYVNDPAIYFLNGNVFNDDGTKSLTQTQNDSINQSFFICGDDVKQEVVYVYVMTMGKVSDQDRPIKLIQTNAGKENAAVPGVHYKSFDDPDVAKAMFVPAGKTYAKIPVTILRDKSLKTEEKRLEFSVAQNEYFRPGIDQYRNFVITTTDLATKPAMWDKAWRYYFGPTFGSVKFKFIINATGYTDFDNVPTDYTYLKWLNATVLQAFFDYNKAHPNEPLTEADGTLVTFE